MASFLSNKEIKKNGLSQINNSNKNLFLKKKENLNKEEIIYYNVLQEKIHAKKNAIISNTSVKKMKQIKKISINDNENKGLILKGKKILDSSNKENHVINNKEKNDMKKTAQKTILKNIVNAAKIQIKQNLPKKVDKNINNIKNKKLFKNKNKLSIFLNNSDNISKKREIKTNKIMKKYNKKFKKEKIKEKNNNSISISHNKSTIIKNWKENDLEYSLNSKEIEYSLRYERKNMSEQKIHIKMGGSTGNMMPLIKMKKEHIKYSLKKKKTKPNINIKNKKLIYEDGFLNNSLQKYNSINNEIDNNRSYIDIINNFDIINIINKKELTKKISSSNQNDSFNHTEELSKNIIIKKNNSIFRNSNNNINLSKKTNKNNKNNKKLKIKKEKVKSYGPMTMRNINPSNKNLSLLNIEKKIVNNNSFIDNSNLIQNKWDKKYFIPIVSASLVNAEDKINEQIKNIKKTNTDNASLNRDNYITHNKKSTNFGDNNKKKREMLFNFSNKKIKNENYSFISFQSKRTNSFISKRNKHITERNNSINNNTKKDNYNSNLENDLLLQEKKLDLILNEISQEKKREKMNNSYKCGESLDNIYDSSFDKNKIEDIINQQSNKKNKNKKYKTYHIKVNSLNIIKSSQNNDNDNDEDYNNTEKVKGRVIIKRGDLLNRLRKIKHNYSMMKK